MMTTLKEKTVLITGANSGIGLAAVIQLARLGAQVLMVARDRGRGEAALVQAREASGSSSIELFLADLSRPAQVRQLAESVKSRHAHLDVLINNAALIPPERTVTPDGLETQFAVNHMAPFVLTNALLPLLEAAQQGRIVNVSSDAHRLGRVDFDDLGNERQYDIPRHPVRGWQAYSNTKLMNILFTQEIARRLAGTRVTANCLHPGIVRTELTRTMNPFMRAFARLVAIRMTPERGTRTMIWLASAPETGKITGKYFHDNCNEVPPADAANDRQTAARLWDVSAALADRYAV